MRVQVRLFAGLRQLVGGDIEEDFDGDRVAVSDLTERLAARYPELRPHFEVIAVAVNEEYCTDRNQLIREGDEVALIQPISGGADTATPRFLVTRDRLEADTLRAAVLTPSSGALVVFEGVVRDRHEGHVVLRLEYEAYEPMAERTLREVGEAVRRDFAVHDVAIHHRVGMLEVGETSLLVAVSAEHRRDAFEAALAAVDRVKESVPVWKREFSPDGVTWQEGIPPRPVA
ncbi:MAG: molybdenum cofactor biosynthesis protein MoaE [Dehalococcoidia bacterium]|nr:molybdenum cofactor biosynthesis protein MoaE [Dehalococcoidia bacterium]